MVPDVVVYVLSAVLSAASVFATIKGWPKASASAEKSSGKDDSPSHLEATTSFASAYAFFVEFNNSSIAAFMVGYLIQEKGIPQENIGAVFMFNAGAVLVVGPFGPKVMRCLGGAPITTHLSAGVMCLCQFALAFLAFIEGPLLVLIFVCFFSTVRSLASVYADIGCSTAILCAGTDEAERTEANAKYHGAKNFGGLLGPPIGGFLYAMGGWTVPFLIPGLGLLLIMLKTAATIESLPQYASKEDDAPAAANGSSKSLVSIPRALLVLVVYCFGGGALYWTNPFVQLYLVDGFGLSQALVGVVIMTGGFFVVIGTQLAASIAGKFGNDLAMASSFFMSACGFIVIGVAPNTWVFCMGYGILFSGIGVLFVVTNPMLQNIGENAGMPSDAASAQAASSSMVSFGVALFIFPALSSAIGGLSSEDAITVRLPPHCISQTVRCQP